jgi:protoheme IX farnesyltransferase
VRVPLAIGSERVEPRTAFKDLIELTKPRITLMVVLTAGIGLLLASGGAASFVLVIHTLVGTGLLAAGSSALNQVLERDLDAMMQRTAQRPLPAGRMHPDAALLFGVALSIVGLLELTVFVNLLRVSSLATVIGAIPGAIPPLMGWTAVTNEIGLGAWVLFGILFLWQLPHFLAIAWMCREDYARAGLPMLPVVEPDGRSTARQMVLWGAALLPVSLLPTVLGLTGITYFLGTLALGCFFLAVCVAFALSFSTQAARRVLLVSVLYLPAVLAVMVLDRVV